MKKLFNINMDCTDYLIGNEVDAIADTVSDLSEMAKTASVHSVDERDILDDENVALIMHHPHIGYLKKFACDKSGVTEVNINLLSKNVDHLPEEIIKVAGNNLGYVAKYLGVDVPENLKVYQTGEWKDPYVDITHINKVAFYQKINDHQEKTASHQEQEKTADVFDRTHFNEDIEDSIRTRLNITHNEKVAELYTDILNKYKNYEPEKIAQLIDIADKKCEMEKAVDKGIVKSAEASTYSMIKTSWFSENVTKLKEKDLPYLSNMEKEALFGEEGEAVFESLPKPTKDKLIEEVK